MRQVLTRAQEQPAEASAIPGWRRSHRSVYPILLLWAPFLVGQAAAYRAAGGSRGTETPLAGALVLGASLAWAVFLTGHLLANGRWWGWLVVSLLPPLLFAAVPAVLLLAAWALGGPAAGRSVALGAAALAAGAKESGFNPWCLRRRPRPPGGQRPVRIISWNTEYWHQHGDPRLFYSYLRSLDADVYLLQEYICHVGRWCYRLLDDDERLFAAFPGYQVVMKGQLVTISRLPVVTVPDLAAPEILRVDVRPVPGASVLSTYNAHIPVQLGPFSPVTGLFYRVVRERAAERDRQIHQLAADLAANPGPAVVAGDFNASPAVGDVRRLESVGTDAIRANRSIYPVSWNCHRRLLRMWRLDWAFVSGGAAVQRYEFLDPGGRSDHCVQRLLVTAGDGRAGLSR